MNRHSSGLNSTAIGSTVGRLRNGWPDAIVALVDERLIHAHGDITQTEQVKINVEKGASLETVRTFQKTMRDAFNNLFSPTSLWQVTRPGAREFILLSTSSEAGVVASQVFGSEALPPFLGGHDLLLIQAIELIKAEKDRLRICQNPKCQKRFVALKKTRARFHSSQCSAYVRVNKARGKM
jgi:predicted RNA-binding Zn ribbon-like protein